jgi:hypothetical protein
MRGCVGGIYASSINLSASMIFKPGPPSITPSQVGRPAALSQTRYPAASRPTYPARGLVTSALPCGSCPARGLVTNALPCSDLPRKRVTLQWSYPAAIHVTYPARGLDKRVTLWRVTLQPSTCIQSCDKRVTLQSSRPARVAALPCSAVTNALPCNRPVTNALPCDRATIELPRNRVTPHLLPCTGTWADQLCLAAPYPAPPAPGPPGPSPPPSAQTRCPVAADPTHERARRPLAPIAPTMPKTHPYNAAAEPLAPRSIPATSGPQGRCVAPTV